jgi:hypothetical protein
MPGNLGIFVLKKMEDNVVVAGKAAWKLMFLENYCKNKLKKLSKIKILPYHPWIQERSFISSNQITPE